jgi:MurNAc alpha-1-phosphate uridylyltransferase
MRAMILAAGRGERLRPLTDTLPKPLAPVASQPLLAHQLTWLARAGVRDIVINLHHLGHRIEATIGTGAAFGVRVRYSHEATRLETGGGIVQALPLLGSEPFLLLNGDIFTDFPFEQLAHARGDSALADTDDAHLVLTPRPAHRAIGDFDADDGRITARGQTYVYCGIAVLRPRLFAGRAAAPFSLRDLLFDALDRQALGATVWRGYWMDIGTPEQLAEVDQRARAWRGIGPNA